MSGIKIEFCTDNAAFDDSIERGRFFCEVEDVLEQVKLGLESGKDFGRLKDSNGNRVGFWQYEEDK
jgi:hypothetical protein